MTTTTPVNKQAFKDIDLDITHYDTDELLTMFNLRDPSEDDIMSATTRLINKAVNDRLPKVAAFFQQAQDALLDELDKQSPPEDTAPSEADAEEDQDPDQPAQDQNQAEDPEDEATDDTDTGKKGSDQLGQWWRNEYLKQADKVQADKPADRNNKIQVLQGNRHMPTKREKLGINETFQVPVTQGTLNPNLKNTVTRLVNIDSQYRQIITPYSENPLGPASPTSYTFDLTENLTNVLSIKLNSIQIPYTWYSIDVSSGTNVLFYRVVTTPPAAPNSYTTYTVPPGNYTPLQLCNYMRNDSPDSAFRNPPITPVPIFDISFNPINGKMSIANVSTASDKYEILFFDPTYHIPLTTDGPPSTTPPDVNNAIGASKVNSNLGWLMGYRGTNIPAVAGVSSNTIIYQFEYTTTPPPYTYVTAEALADTYGPKYLILVLDDYNQNHLNKGLVTIAANDTKLSIPSYFTPGTNTDPLYFVSGGIPVICDASNNPTYVQSNPRNLTQAQLFTINTILQDRNNTTIDRYTGPTTTDVLALIPVKTYSLLPGQPYIEFGSALQTNERVYFGPVNIERMKVQLIDDKGNILNMHGNDWSFTIVSTHLYEY
jgi:hypothetical protein